jgi:hypothetical protein
MWTGEIPERLREPDVGPEAPVLLTCKEREAVRFAVRVSIRKTIRNKFKLREKFGSDADVAAGNAALAHLYSAYRKLGGDLGATSIPTEQEALK